MNSKFIVVEGGGGSGKTTILGFLPELFTTESVLFTREPGGTNVAEEIRSVLLKRRDDTEQIEPEAEILLFEASRSQHLIRTVRPALAAGKHVISDRFDSSTYAYEIFGNERQDLVPFFDQANSLAVGSTVPDLYIFLDVDPRTGEARRRQRNGDVAKDHSYSAKEYAYHERVRAGYLAFFEKYRPDRFVIVDASRTVEEVKNDVATAIAKILR